MDGGRGKVAGPAPVLARVLADRVLADHVLADHVLAVWALAGRALAGREVAGRAVGAARCGPALLVYWCIDVINSVDVNRILAWSCVTREGNPP